MNKDRSIHALFVTDFDGTLYTGGDSIHPLDREALEFLGEAGILRAVATGRSLASYKRTAADFQLPVDYILFSSGAGRLELQTGIIESAATLPCSDVREISSVFEDLGLDYMIHEPIPENHRFFYRTHGSKNIDFERRCRLYNEYCRPMPDGYPENPGTATQFVAILPSEIDLLETVRHRLQQYSVVRTTSPLDGLSTWIEVFPKGVSKSEGVEKLCRDFNIPRSKVCAAGNDYNDLDLLEWAEWSFVPETAPRDLRTSFRLIPKNRGSAVSGAIYRWLEHLGTQVNGNG